MVVNPGLLKRQAIEKAELQCTLNLIELFVKPNGWASPLKAVKDKKIQQRNSIFATLSKSTYINVLIRSYWIFFSFIYVIMSFILTITRGILIWVEYNDNCLPASRIFDYELASSQLFLTIWKCQAHRWCAINNVTTEWKVCLQPEKL